MHLLAKSMFDRGLTAGQRAIFRRAHSTAGADVEAACNAIEELEDTARLAMMMRGINARMLSTEQVNGLVEKIDVEWDG